MNFEMVEVGCLASVASQVAGRDVWFGVHGETEKMDGEQAYLGV